MRFKVPFLFLIGLACLASAARAADPVVNVTVSTDATVLKVGASTTLHVFAQIVPAHQAETDQIFSWYVDLLNSNGAIFQIQPATMVVPTSDKDPSTSSKGTVSGAHLRGIYDTFLNAPGAGHDSPVELFSVTIKALAPGQSTLSVAAGSGVATLEADFVVSVTGAGDFLTGGKYDQATAKLTGFNNTAPTLDSIPAATIDEGKKLTITAAGHDIDAGQTLTYALIGSVPTGASIVATTGVFTWTPAENQGPGVYNISVAVADNATPPLRATNTFSITVNEVNVAPVFTSVPGTQNISELQALGVACVATDSDIILGHNPSTNKITYSLLDPPPGAAINPATGVFSWTPSEGQGPGNYVISVVATDDGTPPLSVTATFPINVAEVNKAPTLTPPANQTIPELSTMIVAFVAADPDLPANSMTFALLSGPPGAVLDPATGVITWTPTEAQGPGTYTITAKVSDGAPAPLSATNTFQVTVTEVNARPLLNPVSDQSTIELSTLTITNIATDSDLPKNTLTYALDTAPAGMTINAATGVLTWTPTEAQAPGSYTVAVRVTDNGTPPQNDTKSFVVTVAEANSAPVLTVPSAQTINELATLTVTIKATDSDAPANTLAFSLVSAPDGVALDPVTGVLAWQPSEAQGPGSFSIKVRVTDNGSPPLSTTNAIAVTVNEVNSAPVFSAIPNQTISELSPLSISSAATDSDLPANTLTYSLIGAPPGAAVNANTGLVTWTPTEAQGPGTFNLTVRVVDNGTPALSATNKFLVTVQEVNLPPAVIVPADQTVTEGVLATLTIKATDPDLPAQPLTFTLVAGPPGAQLNSQTGVLTWTPTEEQSPGKYPVTVTVSDNGTPALSTTKTFNLTVAESNIAPVLTAIPNKSVVELSTLSFTASASDSDIPTNKLTFSLTAAPPGAVIDAATGEFSWTPTEAQGPGSFNVTVKVADDGVPSLSASRTFSITVQETNSPPVLTLPATQRIPEGITITVTNKATDADVPAQTLTYSLVTPPVGVTIQPQTGVLNWTPNKGLGGGTYAITVRVTDNGSPAMNDTESFNITVLKTNSPPVVTGPGDQTVNQGNTLTVVARASDPDAPAQALTFALVTAPAGLTLDAQSGLLVWQVPATQAPAAYPITFKVTDNGSPALSTSSTFTVTVKGTAATPPKVQADLKSFGPGGFKITIIGDAGAQYTLESSEDLKQWSTLTTVTLSAGTSTTFTDSAVAGKTKRFYRAK